MPPVSQGNHLSAPPSGAKCHYINRAQLALIYRYLYAVSCSTAAEFLSDCSPSISGMRGERLRWSADRKQAESLIFKNIPTNLSTSKLALKLQDIHNYCPKDTKSPINLDSCLLFLDLYLNIILPPSISHQRAIVHRDKSNVRNPVLVLCQRY